LPAGRGAVTLEGGSELREQLPPVSPFSKILVALAGPFMNVVFGFAIAGVIYFTGLPVLVNPSYIGYLDPKSAEAQAGIREGDKIAQNKGSAIRALVNKKKRYPSAFLKTVLPQLFQLGGGVGPEQGVAGLLVELRPMASTVA
jgi:membrane-associated protease RseP (regulator of RpoE activity)